MAHIAARERAVKEACGTLARLVAGNERLILHALECRALLHLTQAL